MADLPIKSYFAYTGPFTYLAMGPAYQLERTYHVRLRFVPYGVNIRQVHGGEVDQRDERNRRKLRYLYQDARRLAGRARTDNPSAEEDFQRPPRLLRGYVHRR
jgi:2-hydroxychromene-2-carboxylate isomerase